MNNDKHDIVEHNGSPHATAFTVTFDTNKSVQNKFIKRHIRNLSLPVAKVYENKIVTDVTLNGQMLRKPGNYSEGYFSSDPEDDQASARVFVKNQNSNSKDEVDHRMENHHYEVLNESPTPEDEEEEDDEIINDPDSDVASETGTYTIVKEDPEVITARLNIDANFGIQSNNLVRNESLHKNASRESPSWINEWAKQVTNFTNVPSNFDRHARPSSLRGTSGVSKIPSPISQRSKLGARVKTEETRSYVKASNIEKSREDFENSETQCYLKTTEKVMTALAARLSLDSGGESESEKSGNHNSISGLAVSRSSISNLHRSDSSASESTSSKPNNNLSSISNCQNRYNRSVSLRRSRVEENSNKINSPVLTKTNSFNIETNFKKPILPKTKTPSTPVLARTDPGRRSIRNVKQTQSSQVLNHKSTINQNSAGALPKKKTGGRSNSTLSSKEVEFQNWKRRKSYDPMKAAAEGKKRDAAVKKNGCALAVTTPVLQNQISPGNAVLRSASFHSTRQLGGLPIPSSSEDDDDAVISNEEDWPVPQAPKTSLENTPMGSRLSLYSNSSNPSPRHSHKLEGVDNLVISAVSNLSSKLKLNGSSILRKLRCLFDEENDKSKQLATEIEQLEQHTEMSGSPHRSPSKELASTLRNLKRLDSMLKVLDEVLFEDTEYE